MVSTGNMSVTEETGSGGRSARAPRPPPPHAEASPAAATHTPSRPRCPALHLVASAQGAALGSRSPHADIKLLQNTVNAARGNSVRRALASPGSAVAVERERRISLEKAEVHGSRRCRRSCRPWRSPSRSCAAGSRRGRRLARVARTAPHRRGPDGQSPARVGRGQERALEGRRPRPRPRQPDRLGRYRAGLDRRAGREGPGGDRVRGDGFRPRATASCAGGASLHEEVPHEGKHDNNSFASASLLTDGKRLYAFFGSRGLYALDLTGKRLWEKQLGKMQTRNGFGEGALAGALRRDARRHLGPRGPRLHRGARRGERQGALAQGARRADHVGDAAHGRPARARRRWWSPARIAS